MIAERVTFANKAAETAKSFQECGAVLQAELVAVRRHLHQFPELSGAEFETTRYLAGLLRKVGEPVIADDARGCWVDIGADEPQTIVAIRCDIDALPILSQLDQPYASRVEGVMHACGHDAHAAMGIGAANLLAQAYQENVSPQNTAVRIIMQPAEEISTGALHMLKCGAYEGVSAAIALHVDPLRPIGTLAIREGTLTAACEVFRCELVGKGGHSARPYLTSDTVAAAAAWIQSAQERVGRSFAAEEAVVLNVGKIETNGAANIVPHQVVLEGTARSVSAASLEDARKLLLQVGESVGNLYDLKVNYHRVATTPPVVNNATITDNLREVARHIVGEDNVKEIESPSMGAEDFGFVCSRLPAAMMRIGVGNLDQTSPNLHTPWFDIDEQALSLGAATLAATAICLGTSLGDKNIASADQ